jgi:hypothetical protein
MGIIQDATKCGDPFERGVEWKDDIHEDGMEEMVGTA